MSSEESSSEDLLRLLQSKCRSLTPFAHQSRPISDQDVSAEELLTVLEKCLFNGIRINEFDGSFPFWYMASLLPPAKGIVGELSTMMSLQTAVAKSRGFIRLALNRGGSVLEDTLVFLVRHKKLLNFFYRDNAMLLKSKESSILVALLRSLKVLRFSFEVETRQLNKAPDWLQKYATASMTSDASSSNATLQGTLGKGINYLFRRLDNAAQELLLSNSASQPSYTPLPDLFIHSALSLYDYGTFSIVTSGEVYRRVDPPFFGTRLDQLLQKESRCKSSNILRTIGVPNQLHAMLEVLQSCVQVKGLFLSPVPLRDIQALRLSLENEHGVPWDSSPHAVACCFLQWLYELPEPLLGFSMFDAFQACQRDIDSEVHRLRNLSLLVDAAPWYNKPTLYRVMSFLEALSEPSNCAKSGLSLMNIINFSGAFLLRAHDGSCRTLIGAASSSQECVDRVMRATACCGPVIEVLVSKSSTVFKSLRNQMTQLESSLAEKIDTLSNIQALSVKYLSDESLSKQSDSCFRELWERLQPAERVLVDNQAQLASGAISISDGTESSDSWQKSIRWRVCFLFSSIEGTGTISPNPQSDDPQSNDAFGDVYNMFDTLPGGLLAAQCLATFLKLHPAVATRVLCNFTERKFKLCALPTVALNLVQMCLVELRLVSGRTLLKARKKEHIDAYEHISMDQLAKHSSWQLLDYSESFAEIFGVSLQIFDDFWKLADIEAKGANKDDDSCISDDQVKGIFKSCMIGTRIMLNELLRMRPLTSVELYQHFTDMRISREASMFEELFQELSPSTAHKECGEDGREPNHSHLNNSCTPVAEHPPAREYSRKPCILSAEQIQSVERCLPPELQYCHWVLKYNLIEDGASIETLVRKCRGVRQSILVVQDTEFVTFGCIICDDEWKIHNEQKYYGAGTLRVFTFKDDATGKNGSDVRVFNCTQANTYCMLTTTESMGVGGGGGFAIYMDQELNAGNSDECETFASPCLASSSEFICMNCNVYSIEMA